MRYVPICNNCLLCRKIPIRKWNHVFGGAERCTRLTHFRYRDNHSFVKSSVIENLFFRKSNILISLIYVSPSSPAADIWLRLTV